MEMVPAEYFRDDMPAHDLLRFITCGSVDDGKSTLIGRLLHDSKLIAEDHLAALAVDSARHGIAGEDIDLALLVDGLAAEREQGITIDVAYRFFPPPAVHSLLPILRDTSSSPEIWPLELPERISQSFSLMPAKAWWCKPAGTP